MSGVVDRNGEQIEVGATVCHHELTRKLTWEVTAITDSGVILDGRGRATSPLELEVIAPTRQPDMEPQS